MILSSRFRLTLILSLAFAACSYHIENPVKGYGMLDIPKNANTQMAAILAAHQSLGPKPVEQLSPAEARMQPTLADAVTRLLEKDGKIPSDELPKVEKTEAKIIPGSAGSSIPLRVYTPKGTGPFPVVVYYHGGGWVIGSLDMYDASCRALASIAKAVVISVDYRQGPEHRFPAAHEDSFAAYRYVVNNTREFNGDARRIAVAGESAGGNLAAAVSTLAKQRNERMPVHQLLIYPVTSYAFDTERYVENAHAKPLNARMMSWFFNNYLNTPADGESMLVSPLRATPSELAGLPPATVITAQIDPLRSEGLEYAQKLKSAGVQVDGREYKGVTHEFFGMGAVLDEAADAEEYAAERLAEAFKDQGH